jgi:ketol-acid reductoisomerase
MKKMLDEIQSGQFAKTWVEETAPAVTGSNSAAARSAPIGSNGSAPSFAR